MDNIINRYLLVIIILIFLAALVSITSYNKSNTQEDAIAIIRKIPIRIGVWKGTDIYLEPLVYEILETKSIIHRKYRSAKGNVLLSIVYYPDTKVDFHAPEACLGGAGGNLEKKEKFLKFKYNNSYFELEVNQLIRNKVGNKELIYYFYKAGPYMGRSYFALRMNIAINKIIRENKSGVLIRVTTLEKENDLNGASETLTSFIETLTPFLINYL